MGDWHARDYVSDARGGQGRSAWRAESEIEGGCGSVGIGFLQLVARGTETQQKDVIMKILISGVKCKRSKIVFDWFVYNHSKQKGLSQEFPIVITLSFNEYRAIFKERYDEFRLQDIQDGEDSCLRRCNYPDMDRLLLNPKDLLEFIEESLCDVMSICFPGKHSLYRRSTWVIYSLTETALEDECIIIRGTVFRNAGLILYLFNRYFRK